MTNQDRPIAQLAQGHILGTQLQDKTLPQLVDGFLGVPYALPSTGDRRFRPPVKGVPNPDSVIDASDYGHAAPGQDISFLNIPPVTFSEDCLTANIFRASSQHATPLPVVVYIHGGAFNMGQGNMFNTVSMAAHAEDPFIGVTFNYRLSSLGFLPSRLTAKEGALNLGFRDQILLLEWVRDNITAFGGDPGKVTIYSLSAGAHAVGHHLMNYVEGVPALFHRAILESGSPTARIVKTPNADLYEAQFADYIREAGVPPDMPEDDIFPFLRRQPEEVLIQAQNTVWAKYNASNRWAFQPAVDGDVVPRPPLETWKLSKWHKVPITTGFTTNESSLYVPPSMSTSQDFSDYWKALLPGLTEEERQPIEELYPDPSLSSQYRETLPNHGAQFRRIEAAYSDYGYIGPLRQTADLACTVGHVPAYLFHWALITSVHNRAQHTDNMHYAACHPDVLALSPSQAELAKTYHAYLTSFITTGDPSRGGKKGQFARRPEWKPYDPKEPKAMLFGDGNTERIGGCVGTTAMLRLCLVALTWVQGRSFTLLDPAGWHLSHP